MTNIAAALLVEDNQHARRWLEDCLKSAFPGTVVSAAKNLQEAYHVLEHRGGVTFELALIDIGLPDGSGIDLIARIAELLPRCLSIVTTIYDDDDHIFQAIQAGARGYLLKYHETEKLIGLLQRILDGEPPLSPAIARRMMGALRERPQKGESDDDGALTPREREVLALLGRGFQLPHVSAQLLISQNTAASHVKSIYRKLNISTRAQAAVAAMERGLMEK